MPSARFTVCAATLIALSASTLLGGPTTAPSAIAFGAIGDGVTKNTAAIQKAIDETAAGGGGTIHFPAGKYVTGTIRLKSNVTLHLDGGAVILGSTDFADYPKLSPKFRAYTETYTSTALIFAEDVENVGIEGHGTIDGRGGHPTFATTAQNHRYGERPYMMRFVTCRNVHVRDVNLRDAAMWVQQYLACDNVTVSGISVSSNANRNNDMLDIDCCTNVRIWGCTGDTGDDAIVLKSTGSRICENVTISDCVVSSHSNAIKLGTETTGGFRNITVTNCAVRPSAHTEMLNGRPGGYSGVALEIVDGGVLDRVTVSNIVIEGTMSPIFMRLGNRARKHVADAPAPGIGTFRNVVISNIVATGASSMGCPIAGLPDHPIENVTLRDIKITYDGGGTLDDVKREIPEAAADYPEPKMFGTLPAYGFYVRHVRGLTMDNVQLSLAKPDQRPAILCDAVHESTFSGLSVQAARDAESVVHVRNCSSVLIRGSVAPATEAPFLHMAGAFTSIALISNDLSRASTAWRSDEQSLKPQQFHAEANVMPGGREYREYQDLPRRLEQAEQRVERLEKQVQDLQRPR